MFDEASCVSLSRYPPWGRAPPAVPRAQDGPALGDPHDAGAGARPRARGLADSPEQRGSSSPGVYLSCRGGRLALGTRPGARGRTRGGDGPGVGAGEGSTPPLLLAVQGGRQLGVAAGRSQQRWESVGQRQRQIVRLSVHLVKETNDDRLRE